MSVLIDYFLKEAITQNIEINKKWWIAKPIERYSLKDRLKDCWRILTGKSFACHYYEDSQQVIL